MADAAVQDDFHLGHGWYGPWAAAYLDSGDVAQTIAGLPVIDSWARLGPLRYRHRRSQTNVHSPRLDLPTRQDVPVDLPARLLAGGPGRARGPDMATLEYVPAGSRLFRAAGTWRGRVGILPQAQAPAVDCRAGYAAWLAARSKRSRTRWPKLERKLIGEMGMTFEVRDGGDDLDVVLDQCLRLEQAGWKGRERTAIRDSVADTLFYTGLAREAAAAGALRLALLRHEGRIVAFEYGVVGGDRLFLLKVGYDESYEELSIGHVLAVLNIRHTCEDPAIAWYDKLGNGLTPAGYKLRFADTLDMLYRITIFAPGWRGWLLHTHQRMRHRAKTLRDRWRNRHAVAA